MFWHAVDAHGSDGGEHHADGQQAEHLTGDGVARVLQGQPETPPRIAIGHFLETQHVPSDPNQRRISTSQDRQKPLAKSKDEGLAVKLY